MTDSMAQEPQLRNAALRLSVPARVGPLLAGGGGLLLLATCLWAWAGDDQASRWLHAYLWSWLMLSSVALGALFFVVLQHLTAARWSVVVRRLAELTAATLPCLALCLVPMLILILLGDHRLYHWNDSAAAAKDPLLQAKSPYLNAPFFALRSLVYLSLWSAMAYFFLRKSVAQDEAPSEAHARMLRRWSGPAMLIYAVTVNFAAFDWIMSLDAHWFSTIFGIHFFAGCVVAFLAFLVILIHCLQRAGLTSGLITVEHRHDLGKLLFGFVMFWAYIAFSQYLLIWYANIPEETSWYLVRQTGGWQWLAVALLMGHFVLPFLGLMSRASRRDPRRLLFWSGWLLLAHGLDLHWLIMPQWSPTVCLPGLIELGCLLGLAAITAGVTLRVSGQTRLIPQGDPMLRESIAFHNP